MGKLSKKICIISTNQKIYIFKNTYQYDSQVCISHWENFWLFLEIEYTYVLIVTNKNIF